MARRGDKFTGVFGPYRESGRNQWKYAVVVDGRRTWRRCSKGCTEEEAIAEVEGARRELTAPEPASVDEAIDAFVNYLKTAASEPTAAHVKASLLPLAKAAGHVLVARLSPAILERYLVLIAEPVASANRKVARPRAMATRRTYFLALKRASTWWFRHQYTPRDVVADFLVNRADPLPWATKAGARQIGRGKVQLRNLGEAGKYLAQALARETAEERVAAALPLLTGISSGELRHIQAGAVDFDAGVIHVRDEEVEDEEDGWSVKTCHRVRAITIPESLREDLVDLVDGLAPTTFVFRSIDERTKTGRRADWKRSDEPRTATWLLDLVHRVCRDAQVRTVCPHGLRDTHATLRAVVADQAVAQIGDALGHGDHGKTAKAHYVGAAPAAPVLRVLAGGQA